MVKQILHLQFRYERIVEKHGDYQKYIISYICNSNICINSAYIDSGASSTITGSSTNNFYNQNKGRTKEGRMKKWTIILGVAFAVLAVALSIFYI